MGTDIPTTTMDFGPRAQPCLRWFPFNLHLKNRVRIKFMIAGKNNNKIHGTVVGCRTLVVHIDSLLQDSTYTTGQIARCNSNCNHLRVRRLRLVTGCLFLFRSEMAACDQKGPPRAMHVNSTVLTVQCVLTTVPCARGGVSF